MVSHDLATTKGGVNHFKVVTSTDSMSRIFLVSRRVGAMGERSSTNGGGGDRQQTSSDMGFEGRGER